MINKSELMLGNLIKDETSGEWMEVDNVGPVLSANILNKNLDPMPDTVYMVPIPITRAGLLHINFSLVKQTGSLIEAEMWERDGRAIFFMPFDGVVLFKYRHNSDRSYDGVVLEYLHQVQNLYTILSYPNALTPGQWNVLGTPIHQRERVYIPHEGRPKSNPNMGYLWHLFFVMRVAYYILTPIAIIAIPVVVVLITRNQWWLVLLPVSIIIALSLWDYWGETKLFK